MTRRSPRTSGPDCSGRSATRCSARSAPGCHGSRTAVPAAEHSAPPGWDAQGGRYDAPVAPGTELDELAAEASGCTRCPLSGTRTQVVFGVGDPSADLMFVGE